MANIIDIAAKQTSPPTDIRLPDFLGKINGLGGLAKSCRFAVRIVPTGGSSDRNNLLNSLDYKDRFRDLTYICDAVEFPGRGFGATNIRYYGAGQTVPNNVEYGPCNLSFICTNNSLERKFFDDWQEIVNPTDTFNFNYPNQYYCEVEIFQFSEYARGAGSYGTVAPGQTVPLETMRLKDPDLIQYWKLYKCWPSFVNPQQVTWADNSDVLRLQVTMNYKYWYKPSNTQSITPDFNGKMGMPSVSFPT